MSKKTSYDSGNDASDSPEKESIKDALRDSMKKIAMTGVGTIFLTEETIRNFLSEVKLPKEMWGGFLENANKTKSEFMASFSKELAQVIAKIDMAAEAKKFLEGHKIKLNLEISFDKKGKAE